MKLLFVISSLRGGGAEKVLTTLVNEFVRANNLEIFVLVHSLEHASYILDKRVNVLSFPKYQGSNKIIRYFYNQRLNRKIIKRVNPDIIIPFMTQTTINIFFASVGFNIPIIASEHKVFALKLRGIYDKLESYVFKRISHIVCLTKADYKLISELNRNVSIISNPCLPVGDKNVTRKKNMAIIVGSLDRYKEKGIDGVIGIWKNIIKKHPSFTLHILGTGTEQNTNELKYLIAQNSLGNHVFLEGFQRDIARWYNRATFCIVASIVESFSMVIAEAQTRGCPVISFNCPNGPAELISHEKDGILVENQNFTALENAIIKLAEDKELRELLSRNARENSSRYDIKKISTQWQNLFQEVYRRNKKR